MVSCTGFYTEDEPIFEIRKEPSLEMRFLINCAQQRSSDLLNLLTAFKQLQQIKVNKAMLNAFFVRR